MPTENGSSYLHRRLVQEQELARAATCELARGAHIKLAELYQAKLSHQGAAETDLAALVDRAA